MRYFYPHFIFILIASTANASALPQYHAHKDIQETVKYFVDSNLQQSKNIETKTEISPLDPRLNLSKCKVPLSAFSSSDINQSAKFSVGVKCTDQKPWSIYVTVNVEKMATLYIAASPLARGEAITEEDIQQAKRDINKLRRGFYSDKDDLIGMIAKRSIRAGTIFSNKHLSPPLIIKKGDNVNIIARTGSIVIKMGGKAMSDGIEGQRIRVKNNSSRKIINAIAVTPGIVKVRL